MKLFLQLSFTSVCFRAPFQSPTFLLDLTCQTIPVPAVAAISLGTWIKRLHFYPQGCLIGKNTDAKEPSVSCRFTRGGVIFLTFGKKYSTHLPIKVNKLVPGSINSVAQGCLNKFIVSLKQKLLC